MMTLFLRHINLSNIRRVHKLAPKTNHKTLILKYPRRIVHQFAHQIIPCLVSSKTHSVVEVSLITTTGTIHSQALAKKNFTVNTSFFLFTLLPSNCKMPGRALQPFQDRGPWTLLHSKTPSPHAVRLFTSSSKNTLRGPARNVYVF